MIILALENNRDLRDAALRVQEARAVYGTHRADLFPMINAAADVIRLRLPGDPNLNGPSVILTYKQAVLNIVGWEADFWGRLRNLKEAALRGYLASDIREADIHEVLERYPAHRRTLDLRGCPWHPPHRNSSEKRITVL